MQSNLAQSPKTLLSLIEALNKDKFVASNSPEFIIDILLEQFNSMFRKADEPGAADVIFTDFKIHNILIENTSKWFQIP